jgi:hypothetical protein
MCPRILHVPAALLLQFAICNLQGSVGNPTFAAPPAPADAAATAAVKNLLAIIPSDTLGFGLVNNIAAADAKLQKFTATVGVPAVSLRELIKNDSPGLDKGLDEEGPLAVIVLPGSEGKALAAALVLPVKDYKDVVEQLKLEKSDGGIAEFQPPKGAAGLAAKRGDFLLIAEKPDRGALEKLLNSKESIAAEAAPLVPWLAGNEASLVATRAGIVRASEQFRKQLAKILHDFGGPPEGPAFGDPIATMRTTLHYYGKVLEAAEQEVALAAAGVSADRQANVRMRGRLRFLPTSQFGKSLGQVPPQRQDLLAGLPGGPLLLAAGGATPELLVRQVLGLGAEFMKLSAAQYGLTPDQAEKLFDFSAKYMEHVRSFSLVMRPAKPGESIYSDMVACMRVENAEAYLGQYQKDLGGLNQLLKQAPGSAMKPTEVKHITIAGRPGLELHVSIPLPKLPEGPAQAGQRAMLQAMLGGNDRMTAYMAIADQGTLLVGYGATAERLGEVVEAFRSGKPGLTGDANLAATATLLPAGAQWVGYVDLRGYLGMVQRMLGQMRASGAAVPPFSLPAFPQAPPLGAAVQASPGTLDATVAAPAAVLKAAGEYVRTIQEAIMNSAPTAP